MDNHVKIDELGVTTVADGAIADVIASIRQVLAIATTFAKLTPTTKDDDAIAIVTKILNVVEPIAERPEAAAIVNFLINLLKQPPHVAAKVLADLLPAE